MGFSNAPAQELSKVCLLNFCSFESGNFALYAGKFSWKLQIFLNQLIPSANIEESNTVFRNGLMLIFNHSVTSHYPKRSRVFLVNLNTYSNTMSNYSIHKSGKFAALAKY